MIIMSIPFPEIDPVALQIGPVAIRWYGLAYAAGLSLGWLYIRKLLSSDKLWANKAPMAPEKTDDLLIWIALGVILGGRIGFFIFYEPSAFLTNPLVLFQIWQGGMAFHGGLLGVILAIYMFSKKHQVSIFQIGDLIAVAVPIGIFFGRLANFINQEVYGRITNVPWAMVFSDIGPEPRHPSQLYEATLEGLVLFLILSYLVFYRRALASPGLLSGTFLLGYACARIFAEFFRAQDPGHTFTAGLFTAGIVYSIPMALVGLYFIWHARRNNEKQATTV